MDTENFNSKLAQACQDCFAACCKKGLIFLSDAEQAKMEAHAAGLGAEALAEYKARLRRVGGFYLFDQRDRCQFLTDDNLCSLHTLGIKPNECFWWPYHVYVDGEGQPIIELSSTCCEGWRHHNDRDAREFLDAIDEQVAVLGVDMIREFRKAYNGSYGRRPIRKVHPLEWRPVSVETLSNYREIGERMFPGAKWDAGIERYKALIPAYSEGLQAAWFGDRIVAYVSLWPISERFYNDYKAGVAGDDALVADVLHKGDAGKCRHWFVTAIAIDSNNRLLRRKLRAHLDNLILDRARGGNVIAEAVTDAGARYLKRLGFSFNANGNPSICTLSI